MKKIAVAAPYRGKDNEELEANLARAARIARKIIMDYAWLPIVPHFTQRYIDIDATDIAFANEVALYLSFKMSELCDELWVFGEPTAGMRDEITYAKGLGLEIKHFPLDWACPAGFEHKEFSEGRG